MNEFKRGKNRTIYDIGNKQFVIVTSNNVSIGKSVFPKQIPRKGEISNRMSESKNCVITDKMCGIWLLYRSAVGKISAE